MSVLTIGPPGKSQLIFFFLSSVSQGAGKSHQHQEISIVLVKIPQKNRTIRKLRSFRIFSYKLVTLESRLCVLSVGPSGKAGDDQCPGCFTGAPRRIPGRLRECGEGEQDP